MESEKKFVVKEAWLLNEKGEKTMKLKISEDDEMPIPSLVDKSLISGGKGESNLR